MMTDLMIEAALHSFYQITSRCRDARQPRRQEFVTVSVRRSERIYDDIVCVSVTFQLSAGSRPENSSRPNLRRFKKYSSFGSLQRA